MKYVLSALAAFMLLGAVMSTPAEARCWWNGWTTVCSRSYWGYRPYYRPWWGHRWHRHYWHRRYW